MTGSAAGRLVLFDSMRLRGRGPAEAGWLAAAGAAVVVHSPGEVPAALEAPAARSAPPVT